MNPPNWLSVAEAAAALGLDTSAIYRLVQAKKIPHRRIGAGGGRIVFTQADLDEYLESVRVPIADGPPEPPQGRGMPSKWFQPQGTAKAPRSRRAGQN